MLRSSAAIRGSGPLSSEEIHRAQPMVERWAQPAALSAAALNSRGSREIVARFCHPARRSTIGAIFSISGSFQVK